MPALGRERPGPSQGLGEGARDQAEEKRAPGAPGHIYTTQGRGDTGGAREKADGSVPVRCDRGQSWGWALGKEREKRGRENGEEKPVQLSNFDWGRGTKVMLRV